MVQKHKTVELQDFNPSRLHRDVVQQRCNDGAKVEIRPVGRVEAALRRAVSRENLSALWVRSAPLRVVSLYIAVGLSAIGVVVLIVYQVGVFVAGLLSSFIEWLSSVAVFVVIGGCVGLFFVVVAFVINNTKRAVPFNDKWSGKDTTTTTGQQQVVVNQSVTIVNGQIKK